MMIAVEVNLYASLRSLAPDVKPGQPMHVELADGATLADLMGKLGISPDVTKLVFVNGLQKETDYVLAHNDRVAIFPPIAGGGC